MPAPAPHPADANLAAAHALLAAQPDGLFADYAETLLRNALPARPGVRAVIATLAAGDPVEAARQLAELLTAAAPA